MTKNTVFGVTVVAEGKFLTRGNNSECEMDIFLILLSLFRMTTGTVHIDKALSEMEVRIGILVAVHAGQLAFLVDILGPLFRIDIQRPHLSRGRNLGHLRFAMAGETVLV